MCKLYGTQARKGHSTLERPHRRSCLLEAPERNEAVLEESLEALAAEVPAAAGMAFAKNQNPVGHSNFAIDEWLLQKSVDIIKGPEPYEGGRRWTLLNCPFNPEHKAPVIIELGSGSSRLQVSAQQLLGI